MSLFQRVNDILTANLNDLVDRFEDPEKMLRQAVREMDDAIGAATSAAARAIAGQKLLAKEIDSQRAAADCWQRRAVAAVATHDDDAARRALARRREHERLVEVLDEQYAAAQESSVRLRRRIEAMKLKQAEAGRLLIELAARQRVVTAQRRLCSVADGGVASEVFQRFERLRQRLELADAEIEAFDELTVANERLFDEADPESAAIEAELLELKQHA
jgi:phage shock protein A